MRWQYLGDYGLGLKSLVEGKCGGENVALFSCWIKEVGSLIENRLREKYQLVSRICQLTSYIQTSIFNKLRDACPALGGGCLSP